MSLCSRPPMFPVEKSGTELSSHVNLVSVLLTNSLGCPFIVMGVLRVTVVGGNRAKAKPNIRKMQNQFFFRAAMAEV